MTDNQPQPTEAALLQRLAQGDLSNGVVARWQFLLKQSVANNIFHLLLERGEMSEADIAAALRRATSVAWREIGYLKRRAIVDYKRLEGPHRLLPDAVEEYQRLLRSPELIDTRPMHLKIFELLQARGEMYQEEIARSLKTTVAFVKKGAATLEEIGIIDQEQKQVSFGKLFYRLRPNATERYQQWLASQQPDEPQP